MKDTDVKNKILEATINSIEIYGIEGCTIRNIAREAGITLSSVHYYFESKEALVDKAMELAITHLFDDLEDIWARAGTDHKTALGGILTYFLEGALQFPGITRAECQPLLMQGKTDGLFIVRLNGFLSKVTAGIASTTQLDAGELRLKLAQAFSAVLFLGMSPDSFKDFSGQSFKEKNARTKLIKDIINAIF